jgi:hypothetical protein
MTSRSPRNARIAIGRPLDGHDIRSLGIRDDAADFIAG